MSAFGRVDDKQLQMTMSTSIGLGYQAIKDYADSSQARGHAGFYAEVDKLVVLIKDCLIREVPFSEAARNLFAELFRLRLLYLEMNRESVEKGMVSESDVLVYDRWIDDKRLGVLAENASYALRVQRRVARGISSGRKAPVEATAFNNKDYQSFTSMLGMVKEHDPSNLIGVSLEALVENSLLMDIALIAADMIFNARVEVTEDKVEEVNSLLVISSQSFGGAYYTLKDLASPPKIEHIDGDVNKEEYLENQMLAEAGIEDYRKMLEDFE